MTTPTTTRTASYHDIVGQAASLATTQQRVETVDLGDLTAQGPWIFVGCGASFHAATAAAGLLTALVDTPATALAASDLWMNPDLWLRPGAVVVGLSRTGTTTETMEALHTAHRYGATTVGISLTPNTPVVTEVDHAVVLEHVGERGRVMTRSFSNLLLAAQILGIRAGLAGGGRDRSALESYLAGTRGVAGAVADGIPAYDGSAGALAASGSGHLVILGSGPDLGLCRQGALQAQETARPAVESHAVLDYRHGPLASLTPDSLLVLLTGERSVSADLVVAEDVRVLGGTVVAVGPAELVGRFSAPTVAVPTVGDHPRWLQGNVALPFLQLLAYHLTVARGADPESVRNLDRTKDPHVNPHLLPTGLFAGIHG